MIQNYQDTFNAYAPGEMAAFKLIPRGSMGLELIRARQNCGLDDPGVPFFSLQRGVRLPNTTLSGAFDFGAGRFEVPDITENQYYLTPANSDCLFNIDSSFGIDLLSWPQAKILGLATELAGRSVSDFADLHRRPTLMPHVTQIIDRLWGEIQNGNPNGQLLVDTASIQLVANFGRASLWRFIR